MLRPNDAYVVLASDAFCANCELFVQNATLAAVAPTELTCQPCTRCIVKEVVNTEYYSKVCSAVQQNYAIILTFWMQKIVVSVESSGQQCEVVLQDDWTTVDVRNGKPFFAWTNLACSYYQQATS